jgi:phosphohistidine phosphatase
MQSPFSHFVILQRHAKSSWENQSLTDFERPLQDKGAQQAQRIGRYFADHTSMGGVWEQAGAPDLIACSSAVRTRQTLFNWVEGFCEDKKDCELTDDNAKIGDMLIPVIYAQYIYDAKDGAELFSYFTHVSEHTRTLLLVGHSTALDELLVLLTGGPPVVRFATSGMALLGSQLDGAGWVRPGTFWLLDYVNPDVLAMD